MKMDEVAGSNNDEYYTPLYAVRPIFKYLKEGSTIWCPFDTEESWFVKYGKHLGYNVIHSHLNEGKDFFSTYFYECTCIYRLSCTTVSLDFPRIRLNEELPLSMYLCSHIFKIFSGIS